ncbi:alkane 1-monooxygenase [Solimonas aquatica]|uniref:Alkane 1-monooxygenase n=2 Tax=Solimonas aquatica TaxID=489703 RepID=A0A1H9BAI2_9GAMM|nr:alkane 1-monooxygenase [Solimonas aquatica]
MDYLKYYAASVVLAIGFAGFMLGGDWVWLGASTFLLITALDLLLPRDYSQRQMNSAFWAAIPVWIGGLGPIAIYLAFAWRMSVEPLDAWQILGGTLSCTWHALMPGIAAQHELFHSRDMFTRTVGRYAQFTLFDGMRDLEHVIGHHLDVSTDKDISTAPRGMSIYAYTPQAVYRTIKTSVEAESELLVKKGYGRFNIRHRMWTILLIQILFQSLVYALAGWKAVACILIAMFAARCWTESFSYFQHYGQTRVPGTPIGRRHVWNHLGIATRVLGFELTNHADHHLFPYAPYYKLVPHRDNIEMPGIFVCFIASLIPPLWEQAIIKPALKRWDMEFATAAERKLAREQNLKAGWEDWFADEASWPKELATIGS